ncbi:MAG: chemotaxis protein CheA [Acidobacteria bacterium]|nr:chemotaxis protein CheA [Acidobacteriota bacterium]MDW7983437.1 chemotaxis protein CheA [Acidobacteriota bacterium]
MAARELNPEFLAEAQEILETIGSVLRQFEQYARVGQFKADLVNQLFRSYHSLKGLSSMLGYTRLSAYTHRLEDVLDRVRLGKVPVSPQLVDLLFDSLETLQRLLQETTETTEGIDLDSALEAVDRFVERAQRPSPSAEADPLDRLALDAATRQSLTEYEEHRLREAVRQGLQIYSIYLRLPFADFDRVLREANTVLNRHGELISTLPEAGTDPDQIGFRLLWASQVSPDAVGSLLPTAPTRLDLLYIPGSSPLAEPSPPAAETEAEPLETEIEPALLRDLSRSVRVDLQALDAVLNVVGEVTALRSRQESLIRDLQGRFPEMAGSLVALLQLTQEMATRLGEAQRHLLELRLVPIGTVYGRLERMVRRLARQAGKQVQTVFLGGDTRLDKVLIEHMMDPLVHILRNAVDHGIEEPDERRAQGKPETGTVRIEASQVGQRIALRIADDGRGIQLEKIRQRAIQIGLIDKQAEVTVQDVLRLIFEPGFSLAERVDEVSGRGVGLDIVKQAIERLNGTVTVYTEVGRGTTFEILLPSTLAIVPAVIVRVGLERFAVPLALVQEILEVRPEYLRQVEGQELLQYREEAVPLIRLARVFQLVDTPNGPGFAIVSRAGRQWFALYVDAVERMQEIVIKRISARLQDLRGISGAAEIGEDRPILVLDPISLTARVFPRRT